MQRRGRLYTIKHLGILKEEQMMRKMVEEYHCESDGDIFQIYNKFEDLNKKVTEVLSNSSIVQIIYKCGSDPLDAFRESVKLSLLGVDNVHFKLNYSSSNSEISLSSLEVV
ncbi:hypothetical protein RDI58_017400 [Solanum bulbocastanum]|uniref:Uncharacterized protein n=1 Tax=Solanum bulbocastanum TaxID=147425 RepID=A0AAN8TEL6_SOLBU